MADDEPCRQLLRIPIPTGDHQSRRLALDSVDGAARIVDPIFSGTNTGQHVWGQFLKDYQPTNW